MFLNTVYNHLIYFKMEWNCFEKVHRNEITPKKDVQTTLVFDVSKTYQRQISKKAQFFVFQKHIKISTSKLHNNGNNVDFSPITLYKVRWNDIDFSLIEITSNKKCQNVVDLSTHRNYVKESTSKWRRFFAHRSYVE